MNKKPKKRVMLYSTAEAKMISQETACEKSVFFVQVGVNLPEERMWETKKSIGFL